MKIRLPKHEKKVIKDLANQHIMIPVLNLGETTPSLKKYNKDYGIYTNDGDYGNRAVPKVMVITKVIPFGTKLLQVYFQNPETPKASDNVVYFSLDHELIILTGSTGKSAAKKVIDYKFSNNDSFLPKINFKTGTDPEIFVEAEGKLLPAFEFLGSKADKRDVTDQGCKVYWDGAQAEFDVAAQGCLEGVNFSIVQGLHLLRKLAKKHNPKADLSHKTVMTLSPELLASAKQEHVELGCMPSYNVYGHNGDIVDNPRTMTTRSAGGHIHLELNQKPEYKQTPESVAAIVRAMDAILGVCCVALFAKYDSPERRRYYGLAGEFRLPPHGLEYRTLSNAWLMHPLLMHMVFDLARKSASFGAHGFLSKWKATEAETIRCINNCDVELAKKIMTRNKDTLLRIFKSTYYGADDKQIEAVFNGFYNGVDSFIEKPTDLSGNWELDKPINEIYVATRKSMRGSGLVLLSSGKKAA